MSGTPARLWSKRTVRRFRANRGAVAALVFLLLLIALALVASHVAPDDPDAQNLRERYSSPSTAHWLGTDLYGRDILSRIIVAARISMQAALQAVAIAGGLGVPLGLLAGYLGGRTDALLSRIVDAVLAIPGLLLAFAIVGVLGRGLTNTMIAVGVILSPAFFRVARASASTIRHELYMEASRSVGCTRRRLILRHLLPNAAAPLLVQASFAAGLAIVAEASLSFLGLGVQPPQASWGSMVSETFRDSDRQAFAIFFPAVMISLTIVAFSLLGDGLRDSIGRDTKVEAGIQP
jgi:peptide/nickel transport system permease protein